MEKVLTHFRIAFREAHGIAGQVVATAERLGKSIDQLKFKRSTLGRKISFEESDNFGVKVRQFKVNSNSIKSTIQSLSSINVKLFLTCQS